MKDALANTATLIQMAFWVIAATVAILTYRQARKTVFQPLRTEVFKRQLEDMAEILKVFAGKREHQLGKDAGFDSLIAANIEMMYDAYLSFAFGVKRPEEDRLYRNELCPTYRVKTEALQLANEHVVLEGGDNVSGEPAESPREWAYGADLLALPREFTEFEKKLELMLQNPLLPTSMASKVQNYRDKLDENCTIVENVIARCAADMPSKYPTMEVMAKASFSWIHNEIAGAMAPLEPAAQEIILYARQYFDSDYFSLAGNPLRS